MQTLNSWAAEATRKLEEKMSELRGKLTDLAMQIDVGLAHTSADLLEITSRIELANVTPNASPASYNLSDHGALSPEQLLVQLNNSKTPVDTLRKGDACTNLRDVGWSDKDIAKIAGYTERYIQMLIAHAALPARVRQLIEMEVVSATTAYKTWQKNKVDIVAILEDAWDSAIAEGRFRITDMWVSAAMDRRKLATVKKAF